MQNDQQSIWFSIPNLENMNAMCKNTACEALGIEITEVGHDFIRGTMPADARTFQPFGLVHGGANVLLAETLGSIGANMLVDNSKFYCVGQEVNANHLRGVRNGKVTGTARLCHAGKSSQVWNIELHDDHGKLSCISRLTMAVVPVPGSR
ncbi:MAG: hotdog fold thioesterase [Gammaproteobacteria bacterium]|uniref:hotdog fold thioesterase n=1 Tax=Limnobacter sp. TaxID=2003368 RepID=UPI001DFD6968|nr:hotdog fold thioesterase [Limnobacter sp.]MBU0783326.1 hotdog fold thioesterase [Gammaproteobacteria bacterium]MBU0850545.1 hotdog fold thioesterase [Gammaproteobacteria bacterium]MBU1268339.1 hotdog fold thioesterase [Gammaproteobacteria bacterium]MBU1530183.1 hotdog fold thioesterase [Gammaproteobacteria bacterium]MBU1780557.1 hotdog fold thioesterase [Gammaproteobacteria bacterium]